MKRTTRLTVRIVGTLDGAGTLDAGPWLEAIADRLRGANGDELLVPFRDLIGEPATARLDPSSVNVVPTAHGDAIRAVVEVDVALAAPAPRIAGVDALRDELDKFGEQLRARERRPAEGA